MTSGLGLSGGVLAIVGFANGLTRRGHTVSVVTPAKGSIQAIDRIDPPVRVVRGKLSVSPSVGRPLANALLAFDLARRVPPSDILVATYTPSAVPVLLASALGRGAPYWLFADYREMFVHRPIERAILRLLPSRFRRILTYSSSSRLELPKGTPVGVVGLGLDDSYTTGGLHVGSRRKNHALYVGDGRPRKGLTDFLSSAEIAQSHLPDLSITIVTRDQPEIASSVPIERVHHPTNPDLATRYRQCGVFVSTSWAEGLGLPPLEAMACGAPVVLADQRGSRDYAVSGENCLLVPPRSPRETAEAMVRVLTDPDLSRRLGAAGPLTANRYRWDLALDRFEEALGLRAAPGIVS